MAAVLVMLAPFAIRLIAGSRRDIECGDANCPFNFAFALSILLANNSIECRYGD